MTTLHTEELLENSSKSLKAMSSTSRRVAVDADSSYAKFCQIYDSLHGAKSSGLSPNIAFSAIATVGKNSGMDVYKLLGDWYTKQCGLGVQKYGTDENENTAAFKMYVLFRAIPELYDTPVNGMYDVYNRSFREFVKSLTNKNILSALDKCFNYAGMVEGQMNSSVFAAGDAFANAMYAAVDAETPRSKMVSDDNVADQSSLVMLQVFSNRFVKPAVDAITKLLENRCSLNVTDGLKERISSIAWLFAGIDNRKKIDTIVTTTGQSASNSIYQVASTGNKSYDIEAYLNRHTDMIDPLFKILKSTGMVKVRTSSTVDDESGVTYYIAHSDETDDGKINIIGDAFTNIVNNASDEKLEMWRAKVTAKLDDMQSGVSDPDDIKKIKTLANVINDKVSREAENSTVSNEEWENRKFTDKNSDVVERSYSEANENSKVTGGRIIPLFITNLSGAIYRGENNVIDNATKNAVIQYLYTWLTNAGVVSGQIYGVSNESYMSRAKEIDRAFNTLSTDIYRAIDVRNQLIKQAANEINKQKTSGMGDGRIAQLIKKEILAKVLFVRSSSINGVGVDGSAVDVKYASDQHVCLGSWSGRGGKQITKGSALTDVGKEVAREMKLTGLSPLTLTIDGETIQVDVKSDNLLSSVILPHMIEHNMGKTGTRAYSLIQGVVFYTYAKGEILQDTQSKDPLTTGYDKWFDENNFVQSKTRRFQSARIARIMNNTNLGAYGLAPGSNNDAVALKDFSKDGQVVLTSTYTAAMSVLKSASKSFSKFANSIASNFSVNLNKKSGDVLELVRNYKPSVDIVTKMNSYSAAEIANIATTIKSDLVNKLGDQRSSRKYQLASKMSAYTRSASTTISSAVHDWVESYDNYKLEACAQFGKINEIDENFVKQLASEPVAGKPYTKLYTPTTNIHTKQIYDLVYNGLLSLLDVVNVSADLQSNLSHSDLKQEYNQELELANGLCKSIVSAYNTSVQYVSNADSVFAPIDVNADAADLIDELGITLNKVLDEDPEAFNANVLANANAYSSFMISIVEQLNTIMSSYAVLWESGDKKLNMCRVAINPALVNGNTTYDDANAKFAENLRQIDAAADVWSKELEDAKNTEYDVDGQRITGTDAVADILDAVSSVSKKNNASHDFGDIDDINKIIPMLENYHAMVALSTKLLGVDENTSDADLQGMVNSYINNQDLTQDQIDDINRSFENNVNSGFTTMDVAGNADEMSAADAERQPNGDDLDGEPEQMIHAEGNTDSTWFADSYDNMDTDAKQEWLGSVLSDNDRTAKPGEVYSKSVDQYLNKPAEPVDWSNVNENTVFPWDDITVSDSDVSRAMAMVDYAKDDLENGGRVKAQLGSDNTIISEMISVLGNCIDPAVPGAAMVNVWQRVKQYFDTTLKQRAMNGGIVVKSLYNALAEKFERELSSPKVDNEYVTRRFNQNLTGKIRGSVINAILYASSFYTDVADINERQMSSNKLASNVANIGSVDGSVQIGSNTSGDVIDYIAKTMLRNKELIDGKRGTRGSGVSRNLDSTNDLAVGADVNTLLNNPAMRSMRDLVATIGEMMGSVVMQSDEYTADANTRAKNMDKTTNANIVNLMYGNVVDNDCSRMVISSIIDSERKKDFTYAETANAVAAMMSGLSINTPVSVFNGTTSNGVSEKGVNARVFNADGSSDEVVQANLTYSANTMSFADVCDLCGVSFLSNKYGRKSATVIADTTSGIIPDYFVPAVRKVVVLAAFKSLVSKNKIPDAEKSEYEARQQSVYNILFGDDGRGGMCVDSEKYPLANILFALNGMVERSARGLDMINLDTDVRNELNGTNPADVSNDVQRKSLDGSMSSRLRDLTVNRMQRLGSGDEFDEATTKFLSRLIQSFASLPADASAEVVHSYVMMYGRGEHERDEMKLSDDGRAFCNCLALLYEGWSKEAMSIGGNESYKRALEMLYTFYQFDATEKLREKYGLSDDEITQYRVNCAKSRFGKNLQSEVTDAAVDAIDSLPEQYRDIDVVNSYVDAFVEKKGDIPAPVEAVLRKLLILGYAKFSVQKTEDNGRMIVDASDLMLKRIFNGVFSRDDRVASTHSDAEIPAPNASVDTVKKLSAQWVELNNELDDVRSQLVSSMNASDAAEYQKQLDASTNINQAVYAAEEKMRNAELLVNRATERGSKRDVAIAQAQYTKLYNEYRAMLKQRGYLASLKDKVSTLGDGAVALNATTRKKLETRYKKLVDEIVKVSQEIETAKASANTTEIKQAMLNADAIRQARMGADRAGRENIKDALRDVNNLGGNNPLGDMNKTFASMLGHGRMDSNKQTSVPEDVIDVVRTAFLRPHSGDTYQATYDRGSKMFTISANSASCAVLTIADLDRQIGLFLERYYRMIDTKNVTIDDFYKMIKTSGELVESMLSDIADYIVNGNNKLNGKVETLCSKMKDAGVLHDEPETIKDANGEDKPNPIKYRCVYGNIDIAVKDDDTLQYLLGKFVDSTDDGSVNYADEETLHNAVKYIYNHRSVAERGIYTFDPMDMSSAAVVPEKTRNDVEETPSKPSILGKQAKKSLRKENKKPAAPVNETDDDDEEFVPEIHPANEDSVIDDVTEDIVKEPVSKPRKTIPSSIEDELDLEDLMDQLDSRRKFTPIGKPSKPTKAAEPNGTAEISEELSDAPVVKPAPKPRVTAPRIPAAPKKQSSGSMGGGLLAKRAKMLAKKGATKEISDSLEESLGYQGPGETFLS